MSTSEEYSTSNTSSNLEEEEESGEDVLRPRDPSLHLKTYTAGEDGSRLADIAKEFGLQNQRRPRKQVRAAPPSNNTGTSAARRRMQMLQQFLLDPSTEDARMRAVWTGNRYYRRSGSIGGGGGFDEEDGGLRRANRSWHQGDDEEFDGIFNYGGAIDAGEDDGEYDPHAQGLGGNLSAAVLGIVKGMVGPCILYLPHGFACAGYLVALPIMAVSTIMYLYSSQCLLDAWKIESSAAANAMSTGESSALLNGGGNRRNRTTMLSYPELAYRAMGPLGEQLVKIGIALMQSGVCLTYLIFVPHNLYASVLHMFGLNISTNYWLIVMIILQIPLSWIRDIRKLTPTNFLANALILYGLLTCLAFAFDQSGRVHPNMTPLESLETQLLHLSPFRSQWYLFIGFSVSLCVVLCLGRILLDGLFCV